MCICSTLLPTTKDAQNDFKTETSKQDSKSAKNPFNSQSNVVTENLTQMKHCAPKSTFLFVVKAPIIVGFSLFLARQSTLRFFGDELPNATIDDAGQDKFYGYCIFHNWRGKSLFLVNSLRSIALQARRSERHEVGCWQLFLVPGR